MQSLSSSDVCRRNRSVCQALALVVKLYMLGQITMQTRERAILLGHNPGIDAVRDYFHETSSIMSNLYRAHNRTFISMGI